MLNIVDKLLFSYVVILWNLKSSYQLSIKQIFFVWITNTSHFFNSLPIIITNNFIGQILLIYD